LKNETIPANGEKPCACCGRFHRKLVLVDGFYMGQTCAEHVKLYEKCPDASSIVWRGYEKQHAKVAKFKGAAK
jgi:hypothetical protein